MGEYKIVGPLADQFRAVMGGKNIFTPIILDYREIKGGVVEISRGKQGDEFFGGKYGVTVVRDGEHMSDLSDLFESLTEALDYIKTLQ